MQPTMTITIPLDHDRVQGDEPIGEALQGTFDHMRTWVRDNLSIGPGCSEWIREDHTIPDRIGDITLTLHQVDDAEQAQA